MGESRLTLLCVIAVSLSWLQVSGARPPRNPVHPPRPFEAQRPRGRPLVRGQPPPLPNAVPHGIRIRQNNAAALFKSMFTLQQRKRNSHPQPPHLRRPAPLVPGRPQRPPQRFGQQPPQQRRRLPLAPPPRPGRQAPPKAGRRPPPLVGGQSPPLPLAPNPYLQRPQGTKGVIVTTASTPVTLPTIIQSTRIAYPPLESSSSNLWNAVPAPSAGFGTVGSAQPPAPPVDPSETLYREQSIYKNTIKSNQSPQKPRQSQPQDAAQDGTQDSSYPFDGLGFFDQGPVKGGSVNTQESTGFNSVESKQVLESKFSPPPSPAPFKYSTSSTSTFPPTKLSPSSQSDDDNVSNDNAPVLSYTNYNAAPENSVSLPSIEPTYLIKTTTSTSAPFQYSRDTNSPADASVVPSKVSRPKYTFKIIPSNSDTGSLRASSDDTLAQYDTDTSTYLKITSTTTSTPWDLSDTPEYPGTPHQQIYKSNTVNDTKTQSHTAFEPRENQEDLIEAIDYGSASAPNTFTYKSPAQASPAQDTKSNESYQPPSAISSYKTPGSEPQKEEVSLGSSTFSGSNSPSSLPQSYAGSEPVQNVFTPGPVYYKKPGQEKKTTTEPSELYFKPISNGNSPKAEPSQESSSVYNPPSYPSSNKEPSYQPSANQQPSYQPSSNQQPSYQPSFSEQTSYQPSTTKQPSYQPPSYKQPSYQPSSNKQPPPSYQPSSTKQPPSYQPSYQPSSTKQPPSYQPSYQPSSSSAQESEVTDDAASYAEIQPGFGFQSGEFKIPDFFRNFLSAPPAWINAKDW